VGYCVCGEGGAFFNVPFDAGEGGLLVTGLGLVVVERGGEGDTNEQPS
jgi:hypothetical protein